MEQIINGKKVVWRDKLPAREGWVVMQRFTAMQNATSVGADGESAVDMSKMAFDDVAIMIAGMVESWEFDADPRDPETLGDLNMFTELLPLLNGAGEQMNRLVPDAQPEGN